MGLSSKQVSIDGFDWSKALLQTQKFDLPKLPNSVGGMKRSQLPPQNQNQNQSPELLKCPRCDSTNTKFCYYNNYNKSQPRHFCRTCKRHWTKGGTLRNVPVGGGRKNKRFKKSTTSSANAAATTKSNIDNVLNSQMSVQVQIPKQNLPQKNVSDVFYQELVFPQSLQNFKGGGNWQECENFFSDYGILNTQMSIQSQNPNFSAAISSSTSFEAKQSPISTSNNICNYSDFKPLEIDPTITTPINTHQWQPPTATAEIPSCYWSWDEIDTFTATDLNIPWDDKDIKP